MIRPLYLILLIALVVACQPAAQRATNTSPPPTPTITTTPTSVLQPVLPAQPLVTATPPCDNAPDTQLIVNELGRVSPVDDRVLNVRTGPGTDHRVLGILEVLEVFRVMEGPSCGDEYVWYRVESAELSGWIAEGDFGVYYVEPYLPG